MRPRSALEVLGGLDVLIPNAAFQMTYPSLEDFPLEQIEHSYAVNVFSPFWLIHTLAGDLEDGGCIIVTTSIQAYDPSQDLLDYASTKAALNNLVVNLAQELGPRGPAGQSATVVARRGRPRSTSSPHPHPAR